MLALPFASEAPPPLPAPLDRGYYVWQGVAALLVLLIVVLGVRPVLFGLTLRRRPGAAPGGLLTGVDNRRSTSKVVQVVWTFLVAFMVAAVGFVAWQSGTAFGDILKDASPLYLVLLGGPYAAAALAKVATVSNIQNSKIAKPPAEAPKTTDIVADDNGNVSVYDFQYVLFNFLAAVILLLQFVAHPGHGLPAVPDFLAILTGGAALTYTVNKVGRLDATTGPNVTDVAPTTARIGDVIQVKGTQLLATGTPTVSIGGVAATNVVTGTSGAQDVLDVTVPTGLVAAAGFLQVVVTAAPGSVAVYNNAVQVVPDQIRIGPVTGAALRPMGTLEVTGQFFLDPGKAPGTLATPAAAIGTLTAVITDGTTPWPLDFKGAYANDRITLALPAKDPNFADGRPLDLQLTRGSQTAKSSSSVTVELPTVTAVEPTTARNGDVIQVKGTQLLATGTPTVSIGGQDATVLTRTGGAQDVLVVTVPPGLAPGVAGPFLQVVVTAAPGLTAVRNEAVQVVPDEIRVLSLNKTDVKPMDTLEVTGQFFLDPGKAPGTLATPAAAIGTLKAAITDGTTPWPLDFKGDYANDRITLAVPGTVPNFGPGLPLHLQLARGPAQSSIGVKVIP